MNKKSAVISILTELENEIGTPYINLDTTIEKAEKRYNEFVIQSYTFNRDYFFIIA